MIVTIAKVADFDQFLKTFSTKGAEKRREHGSKGSQVFRDPDDPSRVWVAFDWEIEDYVEVHLRSRGPGNLPGTRAPRTAREG